MPIRIGLIAYGLGRSPGGIGRYTREIGIALRREGLELTLLQAGRAPEQNGTVGLPGARLLPGLLTIGQLEIAGIARQRKLALVHDPTGAMPLLLTGVRRIATVHDVIPFAYPGSSTALDWLIYHFWLPLAIRRLDAVITDSQQSKADILGDLPVKPEKLVVIPAAANPHYRPLRQEEVASIIERNKIHAPYILFVGSIEPRKNLLRLLQAYARLREWSMKWRLVIVGARNYWKSSPVVQAVQAMRLQESVTFTGYVPDADLPALYNGANLFCFPSLYEGFGLPVLEAMACGTPVVTSNTSSLPEVAGDAAILVDPYNVDEIAEAMQRVLSDPDLAADLRGKGLERAKQFSWDRTARETIAVYEKILGGKLI
jgi:glycosyltransferase involved in cell wall biosynthesis